LLYLALKDTFTWFQTSLRNQSRVGATTRALVPLPRTRNYVRVPRACWRNFSFGYLLRHLATVIETDTDSEVPLAGDPQLSSDPFHHRHLGMAPRPPAGPGACCRPRPVFTPGTGCPCLPAANGPAGCGGRNSKHRRLPTVLPGTCPFRVLPEALGTWSIRIQVASRNSRHALWFG